MIAVIIRGQNRVAAATDSALATAGKLFVANALYLSIALLAAAALASVFTKKTPWTRSLAVWLMLSGAAAVFTIHWFLGRPGL